MVRRCGGGRLVGENWLVLCPAHEDHTPSLRLRASSDRVLLKCWAGCTAEAICAAIAIHPRDLFVDELPVEARRTTPKPPVQRMPPAGAADPVALKFAVEFVIDAVTMLNVEGLAAVMRQAYGDRMQRLWAEQAMRRGGLTPGLVWDYLRTEAPRTSATREDRLRARIRQVL